MVLMIFLAFAIGTQGRFGDNLGGYMAEQNKQTIRNVLFEIEQASTSLQDALSMGYCARFKSNVDAAEYSLEKALRLIKEMKGND